MAPSLPLPPSGPTLSHESWQSGLRRRLWLLVPALLVIVLGASQLTLDLARVHMDPVLQDAFKLALGSALASIAVDRALPSEHN